MSEHMAYGCEGTRYKHHERINKIKDGAATQSVHVL